MKATTHPRRMAALTSGLTLFAAALLPMSPAHADLTLTPAGIGQGFSLTTFVYGFPTGGPFGPFGIAISSSGGALVTDVNGSVRRFSTDTDNQSASSATVAQNVGSFPAGLAQVGSNIYLANPGAGSVVAINPDGTFNQAIVGNLGSTLGIIGDPATGHLYVSSSSAGIVYDIDPIAKTAVPLASGYDFDGLSISNDNSIVYGADTGNGHIYGISTLTGSKVYDSGFIAGGIDGTASGSGSLSGNLFVNTNAGTVVEVNIDTNVQTLIASGGSRGDFDSIDPTNNTLLLTQTDRIERLTAGSSGGFGPGGPPSVPEPSTLASFFLPALGLSVLGLRKRLALQRGC